MKPLNGFFVVVYYVVGLITRILHPTVVEGMEHLPSSGVLLCANHSSNWDPILIALQLPVNYRLHIMGKEELFRNPLLGFVLRKVGAFPVSRGNTDIQSIKEAMGAIKAGDNLLIFPEGTVIRNGIGVADGLPSHAKSGVAMIGVRTGATLIPVFVDGKKTPLPPYQAHFRRTLPAGVFRASRHIGGDAENCRRLAGRRLCPG